MDIKISSLAELDALSSKLRNMLADIKELSSAVDSVCFLTVKKVSELTGWHEATTRAVFNRPDFPCCEYGKEKLVEIHALINYFSVPRRK